MFELTQLGLHYYFFFMDSSNKCTAYPIKTSEYGIATALSYNPNTRLLYMGWAPNGPGRLYTINVATQAVSSVTLKDRFIITDMQIEW
jgi:hypothetical protein